MPCNAHGYLIAGLLKDLSWGFNQLSTVKVLKGDNFENTPLDIQRFKPLPRNKSMGFF